MHTHLVIGKHCSVDIDSLGYSHEIQAAVEEVELQQLQISFAVLVLKRRVIDHLSSDSLINNNNNNKHFLSIILKTIFRRADKKRKNDEQQHEEKSQQQGEQQGMQ